MATHKQAEKRHRQSVKRTARNKYYESTLSTMLKGARKAIDAGVRTAGDAVGTTLAYVDKIASKGIIPRGRADRLKSRLASQVAKVLTKPAAKKA